MTPYTHECAFKLAFSLRSCPFHYTCTSGASIGSPARDSCTVITSGAKPTSSSKGAAGPPTSPADKPAASIVRAKNSPSPCSNAFRAASQNSSRSAGVSTRHSDPFCGHAPGAEGHSSCALGRGARQACPKILCHASSKHSPRRNESLKRSCPSSAAPTAQRYSACHARRAARTSSPKLQL